MGWTVEFNIHACWIGFYWKKTIQYKYKGCDWSETATSLPVSQDDKDVTMYALAGQHRVAAQRGHFTDELERTRYDVCVCIVPCLPVHFCWATSPRPSQVGVPGR